MRSTYVYYLQSYNLFKLPPICKFYRISIIHSYCIIIIHNIKLLRWMTQWLEHLKSHSEVWNKFYDGIVIPLRKCSQLCVATYGPYLHIHVEWLLCSLAVFTFTVLLQHLLFICLIKHLFKQLFDGYCY